MRLHELITRLLVYGLYPCWLLAGGLDYWCHRRTSIADTSGSVETWLHVAQFGTMAILVGVAALFQPSVAVAAVCGIAGFVHLVLSYIDVKYTQRKRFISPLEQHIHAFLDILPLVAATLIAVLALADAGAGFEMRPGAFSAAGLWLLGSFLILAGAPVIEEHLRTVSRSHTRPDSARISTEEVMP